MSDQKTLSTVRNLCTRLDIVVANLGLFHAFHNIRYKLSSIAGLLHQLINQQLHGTDAESRAVVIQTSSKQENLVHSYGQEKRIKWAACETGTE
jgi:hypothetical protein